MDLIQPPALKRGDTIGIFTPSYPAHLILREKYKTGLATLNRLGFVVKEGRLTSKGFAQGYRSGSAIERADEIMELILDADVKCLLAVIGGYNSSSILPFLEYELIRSNPKIICGYSDVTALELGILRKSGLCSFYGPAVVPSFGEPGLGFRFTQESFIRAVTNVQDSPVLLSPPKSWSNHFIDAREPGWQKTRRKFSKNTGWIVLRSGFVEAPVMPVNLDTLLALAGTEYFPDLDGCILMIEEMAAPLDNLERNFSHLNLLGVFEKISGLIFSKVERLDYQGADFNEIDLLMDFIGDRGSYPIISNFDCGHTFPMITIRLMTMMRIIAQDGEPPTVEILEPMVA